MTPLRDKAADSICKRPSRVLEMTITLTPEGRTYIASGTWNVLGFENHLWCRGRDLYTAVPGRDSRSKSRHDGGGRHMLRSGSVLSLPDNDCGHNSSGEPGVILIANCAVFPKFQEPSHVVEL